jgi:hypothetical protein
VPYTYLTVAEDRRVKTGYRHLVDNGYCTLVTAQDVLRSLEVGLLDWQRECLIAEIDEKPHRSRGDTLAYLRAQFRALSCRSPPVA